MVPVLVLDTVPEVAVEVFAAEEIRIVQQEAVVEEEATVSVSDTLEQSTAIELEEEDTEVWGEAYTTWQDEVIIEEQKQQEQAQEQQQEQQQEQHQEQEQLEIAASPAEVIDQVAVPEVVDIPVESSEWQVAAAAVPAQEVESDSTWWEQEEYVVEEKEAAEAIEVVRPFSPQHVVFLRA